MVSSFRFMQKIRPDLMPKYKKYEMAAKQRENVAIFSKACEQMGVRDTDLFQTIDLFERKDPVAVANCISRLGSIVSVVLFESDVREPKLCAFSSRNSVPISQFMDRKCRKDKRRSSPQNSWPLDGCSIDYLVCRIRTVQPVSESSNLCKFKIIIHLVWAFVCYRCNSFLFNSFFLVVYYAYL